jgi:hypothetical protein
MCLNEAYTRIRVRVGKHLSDMFRTEKGLKQREDLSPFLMNIALQCRFR